MDKVPLSSTTLAIIALFAMTPAPELAQEVLPGWAVSAATNALTLAGGEQSATGTIFLLKNNSTKPIGAFSVGFAENVTHTIGDMLSAGLTSILHLPVMDTSVLTANVGQVAADPVTTKIHIASAAFETARLS